MIMVDLLRAAAMAVLPLLAWTGTLRLWQMAAVAAIIGATGSLFDPALQASLPALTENERTLQATNGLMDITRRLARAIGPSLAGVLVAIVPISHFFTFDALSYIISAIAVFSLGRRFAWKPDRAADHRPGAAGVISDILGAVRLVADHRPLMWALVSLGISCIAWSIAFTVGVPLLTKDQLAGSIGA